MTVAVRASRPTRAARLPYAVRHVPSNDGSSGLSAAASSHDRYQQLKDKYFSQINSNTALLFFC